MNNLKECIDNLRFDARMLDINMKNQSLSAADLKKHLDKLPDLASNCEVIDLENEHDDHLNGHGQ